MSTHDWQQHQDKPSCGLVPVKPLGEPTSDDQQPTVLSLSTSPLPGISATSTQFGSGNTTHSSCSGAPLAAYEGEGGQLPKLSPQQQSPSILRRQQQYAHRSPTAAEKQQRRATTGRTFSIPSGLYVPPRDVTSTMSPSETHLAEVEEEFATMMELQQLQNQLQQEGHTEGEPSKAKANDSGEDTTGDEDPNLPTLHRVDSLMQARSPAEFQSRLQQKRRTQHHNRHREGRLSNNHSGATSPDARSAHRAEEREISTSTLPLPFVTANTSSAGFMESISTLYSGPQSNAQSCNSSLAKHPSNLQQHGTPPPPHHPPTITVPPSGTQYTPPTTSMHNNMDTLSPSGAAAVIPRFFTTITGPAAVSDSSLVPPSGGSGGAGGTSSGNVVSLVSANELSFSSKVGSPLSESEKVRSLLCSFVASTEDVEPLISSGDLTKDR